MTKFFGRFSIKIEPWFRDGFLYACILIGWIVIFARLATSYARAFLPGV